MIASSVPYKSEVHAYIEGVQSGEITAGRWLKLAVRRHLLDLENGEERGLYFDEELASRAIAFFPTVCRLTKGEWMGQPFTPAPWQMFVIWCVFGWRKLENGYRRFSMCYLTMARKAGKSEFAAGLALLLTTCDDPIEPSADVFTAATKEDQAMIVYQVAADMVGIGDTLKPFCNVQRKHLTFELTNSKLRAIGSDGKTQDGLNPHAVIMDELHAWFGNRHQEFWDKLTSGSGARRQPLTIIITTAGDDRAVIWERVDTLACRVLDSVETGNVVSDSVFAFIARLDDEDDLYDESTWAKANPNMPTTPKLSYLREQANLAKTSPIEENKFDRYIANRKTSSHEKAIYPHDWLACQGELPDLDGLPCFGGFDLGRSNDFCGLALCWPLDDRSGNGRTVVKTWSFTCEERGNNLSSHQFSGYIQNGWLEVNPGDEVDYSGFMQKLLELHAKYNVVTWAYDPSFASPIAQSLYNEHGVPIAKTYQTPKNYNGPTRSFCKAVRDGRVLHEGNGCLDWQVGNLTVSRNANDEWMPDKSHQENKIDAVVSLLMAYRESMFDGAIAVPTFYENNDVEVS